VHGSYTGGAAGVWFIQTYSETISLYCSLLLYHDTKDTIDN